MDPQVKAHISLAILSSLLLSITFLKVDAGDNTIQVPENFNCACPGEVLTYSCNIAGGGTTLWTGSAFDCSDTLDEIRLRHSTFASEGTSGSCNNEAMRARSTGLTNGNCYSSELSVTVSTSFNGRTIECVYNTGITETTIGTSTLTVAAPEIRDVQLMGLSNGEIMLNWNAVPTCARPVFYNVTSNCSTCSPTTANSTTTSCPLPQQWADALWCAFTVQSAICDGNLIGGLSNPLVVMFQEPTVNIVPIYSEEKTLIRVIVRGTNLGVAESDRTTIYVTEYNVTFLNPNTNMVIYSAPISTCRRDTCNATDITPPSLTQICSSSAITVAIRADYGLGERLLSDPIDIGCTNRFIDVRYNQADSTISCVFLNPTNTLIKSCRVTYGPCDQEQTETIENSSTELSSNITLRIPGGSYCYTVTASSDAFTIAVEGMTKSDSSEDADKSNVGGIIGGVVGSIVGMGVVLIVVIAIVMLKLSHQKRKPIGSLPLPSIIPIEIKLKLGLITNRKFDKLDVKEKCTLREAVERSKKAFVRGRTYYEFINGKENISEDKDLIFMNKDTGEYFSPTISVDENNLLGEGVPKPQYRKYRVFIQCTGSGARYLPAGSLLLYEQVQSNPWNPEKAPLQRVISNHFVATTIASNCTAQDFLTKHDLKLKATNLFIELIKPVVEDFRDVMLMDKKTGKLFTGPTARSHPCAYLDKYRVFVLCETENLKLQSGQTVLHQNPESRKNLQFHVLKAENDVQMAKFVEEKLGAEFENGRAFYEFTQKEEDLLFYRDVVAIPKSDIGKKQDEINFKSSIMRFYSLSRSVPGIEIQPKLDKYRVFVQSTSQGSRCLKANTRLLYKI